MCWKKRTRKEERPNKAPPGETKVLCFGGCLVVAVSLQASSKMRFELHDTIEYLTRTAREEGEKRGGREERRERREEGEKRGGREEAEVRLR